MKIEWGTVGEIFLGVLFAGIVLVALNGLFGGWLAKHGMDIHGLGTDGSPK